MHVCVCLKELPVLPHEGPDCVTCWCSRFRHTSSWLHHTAPFSCFGHPLQITLVPLPAMPCMHKPSYVSLRGVRDPSTPDTILDQGHTQNTLAQTQSWQMYIHICPTPCAMLSCLSPTDFKKPPQTLLQGTSFRHSTGQSSASDPVSPRKGMREVKYDSSLSCFSHLSTHPALQLTLEAWATFAEGNLSLSIYGMGGIQLCTSY